MGCCVRQAGSTNVSSMNCWTLQQKQSVTKALRVTESAKGQLLCPSCGEHVVRNGHSRGLQRYLCRACARTFSGSALTGTVLDGLHSKHRLHSFAECMARGASVRETAAALNIAPSAALRMRHRFVDAVVQNQPKPLKGMVEVDEAFLRESLKGTRRMPRAANLSVT